MDTKKHKTITLVLFLLILICLLLFAVFQMSLRTGLFLDEIYTYGLSNSYHQAFLTKGEKISENTWMDHTTLWSYITVQNGERFSFSSVYNNTFDDVHPPLYYYLVHLVCSFFPDAFSMWLGWSLNLMFFSITIVFLCLLAKLMLKNDYLALCTITIYGFSIIGIDTVVFIRMYMLMTMFAVVSFYFHYKLLEADYLSSQRLVILFIVTYLGCMTQYHFVILSFFLALFTCLVFLYNRKIRDMFKYGFSMLFAVLSMMGTYPAFFHQLFGRGGKETLKKSASIKAVFSKIFHITVGTAKAFVGGNTYALGFTALILLLLLTLAIWKILRLPKGERLMGLGFVLGHDCLANSVIILGTVFSYGIVSGIAFYTSTRYIYFLYPVLVLILVGFLYVTLSLFLKKTTLLFLSVLCAIFAITGVVFFRTSYLSYNQVNSHQEVVEAHPASYGVVFGNTSLQSPVTQELFSELELKAVYATKYENSKSLGDILLGKDTDDGIIVWVDNRKDKLGKYTVEEIIQNSMESSLFTKATPLYCFERTDVYYLSKD